MNRHVALVFPAMGIVVATACLEQYVLVEKLKHVLAKVYGEMKHSVKTVPSVKVAHHVVTVIQVLVSVLLERLKYAKLMGYMEAKKIVQNSLEETVVTITNVLIAKTVMCDVGIQTARVICTSVSSEDGCLPRLALDI